MGTEGARGALVARGQLVGEPAALGAGCGRDARVLFAAGGFARLGSPLPLISDPSARSVRLGPRGPWAPSAKARAKLCICGESSRLDAETTTRASAFIQCALRGTRGREAWRVRGVGSPGACCPRCSSSRSWGSARAWAAAATVEAPAPAMRPRGRISPVSTRIGFPSGRRRPRRRGCARGSGTERRSSTARTPLRRRYRRARGVETPAARAEGERRARVESRDDDQIQDDQI